jgi:hypothetical protein
MARPASTAGEVIAVDDEPERRELLAGELSAFAERPNRVLPRDDLLQLAHGRGWEG